MTVWELRAADGRLAAVCRRPHTLAPSHERRTRGRDGGIWADCVGVAWRRASWQAVRLSSHAYTIRIWVRRCRGAEVRRHAHIVHQQRCSPSPAAVCRGHAQTCTHHPARQRKDLRTCGGGSSDECTCPHCTPGPDLNPSGSCGSVRNTVARAQRCDPG